MIAKLFLTLRIFLIAVSVVSSCSSAARSSRDLTDSELHGALQLLAKLGYWTGEAESTSDEPVYFATLAFQRVIGIKPTGRLTVNEIALLRAARPVEARSTDVHHIEVDLKRQILFVVEPGGFVRTILPISSGNRRRFRFNGHIESGRTPVGTFQVYRKIDGWHDSPLGDMYYSSYIYRGIAVHGSKKFAESPSTHGCISIPLPAAISLSKEMPVGTVVVVYN